MSTKTKRAEDLSVIIQAGGESRRMGKPKATIPFLGHGLIWQSVERLYPIATEMVITTNDIPSIEMVFAGSEFQDIRYEPDIRNERGALNGLFTALSVAHQPYVALSACDMVFASPELFLYEYHIMKNGSYDLVIPHDSNGFEPFHAIYRRESCLSMVERALEAGERKMSSWFPESQLLKISRDDILKISPQGGTFLNINTPDQLTRIEERIKQGVFDRQERQDHEAGVDE